MTSPTLRSRVTRSRLMLLRTAALLAGILILLGAAIISMGTALLAPIGMWAFGAFRHKRHGEATRAGTWMAAMTWVAVGLLFLAGVAGSVGWAGSMLCGFAILGRWPNGLARDRSGEAFAPDLSNAAAS